ncbi:MAG: extracellular solute-binding protein [Alphaproteobacteria bacterium]|nr:extracellular solute-binding protein [Alphaproteobacteria bacterium]
MASRKLLIFFFLLFLSLPAFAQTAQHGIALHGQPKYAAGFTHFDYANPDAPKGGEVRLASIGTFDNLNPYILKGLPATDAGLVFETLMASALDEPFSQYGWVAESVTVAPDRGWVSYKLRPEARFHDGKPVTPEDVIFSFETLRDKGHPFYRSYYKDVVKAEKTGPHEIKFTFRGNGNTELPLIMGQLPVLAKHFWKGKDFAATTLEPIPGSGPYKIESLTPGRDIVYKRVADWWAKDLPVNKGRYNFNTIRYDYYRDATVALEALFAGRYDLRLENIAKEWATSYTTDAVKKGLIIKQEIKNELPSGMQAFAFNTRRDIFKDPRVREALGYAFDFEWANKNFAYGAYKRTTSYFANSELAAEGLPSPEELKILEPYRGKIPDEVFTSAFKPPVTDGSGDARDNLKKAAALLREAGWNLKDGKLVNAKGEPLKFEIVDASPLFERWIQPFLRNLERLGVQANFRVVDTAQYQNLIDNFDYDMIVHVFSQSLSPGNEQRDYWSSSRADLKGGRNLIGIKNPVVDDLVEKLIHAKDRAELVAICHALDRVLLWNYYVIPHWYTGAYRVAYWDMFGEPKVAPKYGLGFPETWWIDGAKMQKINAAQKRNR